MAEGYVCLQGGNIGVIGAYVGFCDHYNVCTTSSCIIFAFGPGYRHKDIGKYFLQAYTVFISPFEHLTPLHLDVQKLWCTLLPLTKCLPILMRRVLCSWEASWRSTFTWLEAR